jgi:hypothetical protein
MVDLPRDVHLKLIPLFDIDTRRALDIYTKLKVPVELQNMIGDVFRKLVVTKDFACERLGERRHVNLEMSHGDNMYIITRTKMWGGEEASGVQTYEVYVTEHIDKTLNAGGDFYNMHVISSYDQPEMTDWPYTLPMSSIGF